MLRKHQNNQSVIDICLNFHRVANIVRPFLVYRWINIDTKLVKSEY